MAIHAWRMTLRPAARLAVVPRTVRAYATQRTSKMSFVSKLFSDPVIETIVVASRIARILLGSVLVVGGTTLVAWEGMHQYVEHAAMPSRRPRLVDADDKYGFAADAHLDAWTQCEHTDSRLGMFGRHIVRSAWMAQHWGSGITPSVMFGHRSGSMDVQAATENQGLRMAEQFLHTSLHIAENKHIAVPDEADSGTAPDPAAVRLELWLASVREQLGTPASLERAINACEKVYDVVPDDILRTHVATRLGTQYTLVGKAGDGVAWLDRAMKLGGTQTSTSEAVDALLARRIPVLAPRDERTTLSILQTLSALHAHQPQGLHQALRTQLAALRLASAVASPTPTSRDGVLHRLWVEQKQSVLAMHVAETLYALKPHRSRIIARLWPSLVDAQPSQYGLVGPTLRGPYAQSRTWLTTARDRAASVCDQLTHPDDAQAQQIQHEAEYVVREATRLLQALDTRT